CNYDGYASMRYAVLVGASTEFGNVCMCDACELFFFSFFFFLSCISVYSRCAHSVAEYSEPCSAMLALAPGGRGNFKIHTSDLLNSDGLTPGYVEDSCLI